MRWPSWNSRSHLSSSSKTRKRPSENVPRLLIPFPIILYKTVGLVATQRASLRKGSSPLHGSVPRLPLGRRRCSYSFILKTSNQVANPCRSLFGRRLKPERFCDQDPFSPPLNVWKSYGKCTSQQTNLDQVGQQYRICVMQLKTAIQPPKWKSSAPIRMTYDIKTRTKWWISSSTMSQIQVWESGLKQSVKRRWNNVHSKGYHLEG
jgi:hypothetical protein